MKSFKEKKLSYGKLRGTSHLEADRELLRQLAPGHQLLKRTVFQPAMHASEILYALIEIADEETIVRNRRQHVAATSGNPVDETDPIPPKDHQNLAVSVGAVLYQEGKAYEYTEEGFREIPVVRGEEQDGDSGYDILITCDGDLNRVVMILDPGTCPAIDSEEGSIEDSDEDPGSECPEVVEDPGSEEPEPDPGPESEKKRIRQLPSSAKNSKRKPSTRK